MQVRLFSIPVSDDGQAVDELNRFLRGCRVLEVEKHFVPDGASSCWCLCVTYLEDGGPKRSAAREKRRVDYKEVLSEQHFAVFARLRQCRKQIAQEDGIPAFAVFTDAQLAEMAQLEDLTAQSMQSVKGVGTGKIERYGERFVAALRSGDETSEEGGQSVPENR